MKTAYRTANAADAHVVASWLEQHGVRATVVDEHLGPYGHPLGSVRVVVPPENEADARKLLAEWEAQSVPDGQPVSTPRPWSRDSIIVVLGIVAVIAIVWYFGGR